jgi:hypothetical protein
MTLNSPDRMGVGDTRSISPAPSRSRPATHIANGPPWTKRLGSAPRGASVCSWHLTDLLNLLDVRFAPIVLRKSAVTDGCRSATAKADRL